MEARFDQRRSLGRAAPWLLIGFGLIWLGFLLRFATPGHFVTGDAGMKFLLVEQWAAGQVTPAFHVDVPEWLSSLWSDTGTFPFGPPFLYANAAGEWIFAQPVPFLGMTAPLFAVFGWAGLFILPMLSVLLLWIRCWQTCRVLGLSQTGTTFALATLIFGLAITPYGAMFWEHAPATALAFFGIAELVEAQVAERSRLRLFLGGLLVGASAWLRPEAMVLAALVCALWAIPYWQARRTPAWMMFATGAGLAIIAFLLYNVLIYGGAFGLHSRQEGVLIPGVTAWTRARTFGWGMITLLVRTAPPVTVAVALGAWIALRNRTEQWRFAVPLVALVPAMVLAVPWIAPNAGGLQWGARYMLTALPVAAIICGWIVSKAGDHRHGRLIVATLGIALLAGAVSNVYAGTRTVHYMYQGRTEVLHGIADSNPGIPIVATDQYIPQELAGDLRLRPMFVLHEYPWNTDKLLAVAEGVREAGHRQFVFVVALYSNGAIQMPARAELGNERHHVEFTLLPLVSKDYHLYRAVIDDLAEISTAGSDN